MRLVCHDGVVRTVHITKDKGFMPDAYVYINGKKVRVFLTDEFVPYSKEKNENRRSN